MKILTASTSPLLVPRSCFGGVAVCGLLSLSRFCTAARNSLLKLERRPA